MNRASSELVVVTGGAGFIGSHLVEALLTDGYRVRVADNLSTGHRANLAHLGADIELVEGDLADFETACRAVADADAVLHQAAIPSVPRSVADPLGAHASGPTATLNVLEAARRAGVRRVVFAASSSAYGDTVELPKHEAMPTDPLSPYAAGKLAGESYVRVYARTMGLDGVSLRYFNVFGPRQDPSSPYSGVISRFAQTMRAGQRPTIHGDGRQTRDFTYVANVVQANLLALRHPRPLGGAVYNVGTGGRVSLLELVARINAVLGTALAPEFAPPRPGDVRDSQASLDRIRSELGYEPVVDFAEGLRRTLADDAPTASPEVHDQGCQPGEPEPPGNSMSRGDESLQSPCTTV
jgi:UDP-glucose 4-epimerase